MRRSARTCHDDAVHRISALWMTPVKGLRLQAVDSVTLDATGAVGNRRFYVVDETGRMLNGKVMGELQTVTARCDDGRLRLDFGDGAVVDDEVRLGESVMTRFFSLDLPARAVIGPWSEALSQRLGRTLRLMEADVTRGGVDRGDRAGVSLFSTASLQRLGVSDPRRFRMLMQVDGPAAHEEDDWVGSEAEIGETVVAIGGHVGRCLVTGRDPETGVSDLPTLEMLRAYRGDAETTERNAFGVYGRVLRGGTVRVGDACMIRCKT